MTKKILAVIPARGGSKGLPKKNIVELEGKPLVAWSIEAAVSSKLITKTVVSSDSDEILDISKRYGADTIKRPPRLSTDSAKSESALLHVIKELKKSGEEFDYIVLLQPTSPLRGANDIDAAFEKFFQSDATALISVYETDNKILKAFKENDNGYIEGISNNRYPFARRQDLPKTYMSNGAIYIIKTSEFIRSKKLFSKKSVPFEMDEDKSLDIDTADDLNKAKKYLSEKRSCKI